MAKEEVCRSLYYYDLYAVSKNERTGNFENSIQIVDSFLISLYEKQKLVNNYVDFLRKTKNENEFFIIIDCVEDAYIKFRIVLCRTDALPFIEKEGKLDKLGDYIDPDQNIAEITHCVYFRNNGIMGGEYNFSGARPTIIADYMMKYGINASFVTCKAKLNYDAYTKILAEEEFTLFDFSVKTNSNAYNDVLSKKGIFKAIQETVPESDTMEVIIRRRKTKKNKFKGFNAPIDLNEIKVLLTDYRDDIERFKVSQATLNEKIDLLSDKLVHKISIIGTKERTINSNELYREIINYFNNTVIEFCNE